MRLDLDMIEIAVFCVFLTIHLKEHFFNYVAFPTFVNFDKVGFRRPKGICSNSLV